MAHQTHLPHYAALLLERHLDAFTKDMIHQSFSMNVPLLRFLSHLSEEELFQFSRAGNGEFLTCLSQNKSNEYIATSIQRWLANQLPLIGKFDIEAKDITLINHVRGKVLKNWMQLYTTALPEVLQLVSEIDDLILAYNTAATNAYIQILKGRIEEEAHFNTHLIDTSPGITFILDLLLQQQIFITGKVEEVFGYTPEEVKEMPDLITRLSHPEDVGIIAAFLQKVIEEQNGRTHQAEYRFKNKEGSYLWIRCYAVVYKRDSNGQPTEVLGVAYEISNEKEIASALMKREQQLLEAQAIGHIGSYEWDIVQDTSVSTPELRRIFEASDRQTFREMMSKVHPQDTEKVQRALETSFSSGQNFVCEYRFLAPSGEKIIDAKGVVYYDAQGAPATLMGTVQDITNMKRAEERLLQKTRELERSNSQLQEFAYIASHDLKEPLRKISLYASSIMSTETEKLSPRGRVNVEKISESVGRMNRLIDGILSYSSLSAGEEKVVHSLEAAFQEAVNNLEFTIRETGAVVWSDGLPEARVVPFQLEQLFQNLIANALKFSRKGIQPQVRVTHTFLQPDEVSHGLLEGASQYLLINITDNGIGFNEEAAEKIFGLFQRLHTKKEYEGSGLGLAICKRIVENHGGMIRATSQEGEGATFSILLPQADN